MWVKLRKRQGPFLAEKSGLLPTTSDKCGHVVFFSGEDPSLLQCNSFYEGVRRDRSRLFIAYGRRGGGRCRGVRRGEADDVQRLGRSGRDVGDGGGGGD